MTRRLRRSLAVGACGATILATALVWRAAASRVCEPSAHCAGRRFRNVAAASTPTFAEHVAWLAGMRTVPWPRWIEDRPQPLPPARVGGGRLRVTFINHATTLIQVDSLNILTDPIWSGRAGPFGRTGAARVRAPGVRLEDLPPIDVVLVSHDHYDHLDAATIQALEKRHRPRYIAGLRVGGLPPDRTTRLDWWQSAPLMAVRSASAHGARIGGAQARVTFVPARHQSGRWPLIGDRTLWGGFVVESPSGVVYFAGDTGPGSFIDSIAARFPRIRLAILPIGASRPTWFMGSMHMSGEDAVAATLRLGACQGMGVHFGTFAEHAEEPLDGPARDVEGALRRRGLPPSAFWTPAFGEGLYVPQATNEHGPPPAGRPVASDLNVARPGSAYNVTTPLM